MPYSRAASLRRVRIISTNSRRCHPPTTTHKICSAQPVFDSRYTCTATDRLASMNARIDTEFTARTITKGNVSAHSSQTVRTRRCTRHRRETKPPRRLQRPCPPNESSLKRRRLCGLSRAPGDLLATPEWNLRYLYHEFHRPITSGS